MPVDLGRHTSHLPSVDDERGTEPETQTHTSRTLRNHDGAGRSKEPMTYSQRMSTGPGTLLLLDSASLYFRAFYGVPDERADPQDPPTNAVRGFLDMIATLVERYRPSHVVACWDDDWRPAWRVAAIPTYKTHRVAVVDGGTAVEDAPADLNTQVPIIIEALAALGIPRWGAAHYEADDVIGTLVARAHGTQPVDVVTGDRDLFQLVDDAARIRVLYTARGGVRDPDLVDQAFLSAKYGVPTGAAYADLAVLRGDSSDGLPGVRGIGEKTGAALLERYGTLSGLIAAVDGGDPAIKGAQRTRLEEGRGYLDVAPAVVRVAADVPLPPDVPPLPQHPVDPSALDRLARTYRITGPVSRVTAALASR